MGRGASPALASVALLGLAACGSPAYTTAPTDDRRALSVQDLAWETFTPDGTRMVVRAEEARLTDLPGRGHGSLREVTVQVAGGPGDGLRVAAPAARIDRTGAIVLKRARVDATAPGLRLEADEVRVDRASAKITAKNVQARLRAR